MATLKLITNTTENAEVSNDIETFAQTHMELLQKIYEIGIILGSVEDPQLVLAKVAEICLAMANCQCVSIFSIEGRAISFRSSINPGYANEGACSDGFKKFLIPIDNSTIIGHCVLSKSIIAWTIDGEDITTSGHYYTNTAFHRENFEQKSLLVIPILDPSHKVIGVLELCNYEAENQLIRAFPAHLYEYMRVLAIQIASVLKTIYSNNELKRSWTETVLKFVKACESRDPETGGHVERIGFYSKMLYSKLGYSKEACEVMRLAAMLHDIGKLSVPDSILKKPGILTPDERLIMQQHALAGYRMLAHSESPMLQMGAVISATHHEKWDGSGYPQKLRGTEIPLVGRIVALADVFDALCSKRCYKEAWPVEKVLETICEESGKHFDPDLVKLFQENLASVIQIFHDYSVERFTHDLTDEWEEKITYDLTLPKIA